jgi:outer membrane scaffolding protein for murein synthesis (MipA/OmpV family)
MSIGAHLEWDHKLGAMPINLLGRVRQFASLDRGAQADVRFTAGVYGTTRAQAGVFVQAAWANAKSARTYYGVTPQASTLTGLTAFEPGRGPLFTSAGALGLVDLHPHWVAVWNLEVRHLQGDAALSPLTERATNYYANVGLAFRF